MPMNKPVSRIAIVGTGVIGASWAAQYLARYRRDESEATRLADCKPPAWVFLRGLKLPLSSTQLRTAARR